MAVQITEENFSSQDAKLAKKKKAVIANAARNPS
jgi:hypothetical protein